MTREEELELISAAIADGKLRKCVFTYENKPVPFHYKNKVGRRGRNHSTNLSARNRERKYRNLGLT